MATKKDRRSALSCKARGAKKEDNEKNYFIRYIEQK